MASGDSLVIFTPLAVELPATNYAQIGVRNNHPTVDFDQTTQESVFWTAVLPRNYAGGGITAIVKWVAVPTSGNAQFLGAFERVDAGTLDIDADSFAATQSTGTTNVNATSGIAVDQTIVFTNAQIDGLLAGELFRFRLQRDPATDTAAGDVQVLSVELKET